MNKSSLTFIFLVFSAGLFAQSPNAFNYQAALRDNQGALLNSQSVGLKVEIENASGVVYTEESVVQTNAFGIINVQVGVNPSSSNTFADIDWSQGPYSLKTYVDPNGGQSYQFNSSSDILSVPYAKYAQNSFLAQTAVDVDDADSDPINELQFISLSNDTLYLTNGGYIILPPDNVNDADHDTLNEIQTLNKSGNTITLSENGGSVTVFDGNFFSLTNTPLFDTSNSNELQVLNISGDTLSLSNGGYIILPPDNVNDADHDTLNEIQTLNKSGNTITLSENGGSVTVFDGNFFSLTNTPLFDTSNSNELQVLNISGDTLSLSNGGYVIVPSSKWIELNGSIYRNSKVGINTSTPFGLLEVKSLPGAGGSDLGITITRQSSNNNWGVPLRFNLQDALGQTYRYGQIVGGILNSSAKTGILSFHVANGVQWGVNYEQERMRLTPMGLGIGVSSPQRDLHVAGSMRLSPLQSSPSNGSKGDLYINTSGEINYFNGNEWVNPTQQLNYDSDTLSLSNGGYVIVPQVSSLNDLNDAVSNSGKLGLGLNALNISSTATDNVAVGMSSLSSVSTGESNVAVGSNSMAGNLTGSHNTANGYYALRYNVSGSRNTGVGSRVMMHATGSDNTAMGEQALYSSSGNGNIAFGNGALYNNTTGSLNDAIGYGVLNQNTTGDGNTAIGHNALNLNTTGSRNIAIGYNANVSSNNLTNAIAIGYNAEVSISNAMVLGGIGADAVKVGIGTSSPARSLHINDVIRLEPISAPPANPSEGDIYMDSGSHKLMVFDGNIWQACW